MSIQQKKSSNLLAEVYSLQLCLDSTLDSTQLVCAGEPYGYSCSSYRGIATTLFLSESSVRRYCIVYMILLTQPSLYKNCSAISQPR